MDTMIVFDMDGVLIDVSESYMESIVQTVYRLTGRVVSRDDIYKYKNLGGWNNDWALSQRLAKDFGVEVSYPAVVDCFNETFLGPKQDGLICRERWLPNPGFLERLAERYGLAIFTGRLRYEAEISLRSSESSVRFDPMICSEDVVSGKPSPDGLLAIRRRRPGCELLYVGDTVDDARAAKAANVPFLGIAAPSLSRRNELIRLFEAEGAVAILENVNGLERVL